MQIADLDKETRLVVYLAHLVVEEMARGGFVWGKKALGRKLTTAVADFDSKHEAERTRNLLKVIFDDAPEGEPARQNHGMITGTADLDAIEGEVYRQESQGEPAKPLVDPVDARDEKGERGELLEEACGTCSVCEEEEMQVFLFPCGHWACSGCHWRLDDGECGCDNCDPAAGPTPGEGSAREG